LTFHFIFCVIERNNENGTTFQYAPDTLADEYATPAPKDFSHSEGKEEEEEVQEKAAKEKSSSLDVQVKQEEYVNVPLVKK